MGQSDPCRAQLATASNVVLPNMYEYDILLTSVIYTYSAYSTTLLFPS
jgi:hypothetical protein